MGQHPLHADIGMRLQDGSYEQAREWIGRKLPARPCEDAINWAQIKYFCSLVEDANPNYWDEASARARYDAIISPPGMLMVWQMQLRWRPDSPVDNALLATSVPLPGDTLINVSTDSEFLRPIKVGDRLTVEEAVVEVSPEKQTQLGPGHFITTLATFRNHAGEIVATNRNVLLRYRAVAASEGSR